jgi:hypothetical protein
VLHIMATVQLRNPTEGAARGTVAWSVGKIEANLNSEVIGPS